MGDEPVVLDKMIIIIRSITDIDLLSLLIVPVGFQNIRLRLFIIVEQLVNVGFVHLFRVISHIVKRHQHTDL